MCGHSRMIAAGVAPPTVVVRSAGAVIRLTWPRPIPVRRYSVESSNAYCARLNNGRPPRGRRSAPTTNKFDSAIYLIPARAESAVLYNLRGPLERRPGPGRVRAGIIIAGRAGDGRARARQDRREIAISRGARRRRRSTIRIARDFRPPDCVQSMAAQSIFIYLIRARMRRADSGALRASGQYTARAAER